MKKYDVIRKIRDDDIIRNEIIKAYLYTYRDIDFAIYNSKDYHTDFREIGYISIIRTCNDKNGLSFDSKSYKTIKECYNETVKIIDKCYKGGIMIDDNMVMLTKEQQEETDFVSESKFELESYMKKDELLKIVNDMDFIGVKQCNMYLITGFIVNGKNKEFKVLTKNVSIY